MVLNHPTEISNCFSNLDFGSKKNKGLPVEAPGNRKDSSIETTFLGLSHDKILSSGGSGS